MSLALSAKGDPSYDQSVAARWQAAQVSTLSIMNCSGRIFIGELLPASLELLSDNRTWLGRPYLGLREKLFRVSTFLLSHIGRLSIYYLSSPHSEYRRC